MKAATQKPKRSRPLAIIQEHVTRYRSSHSDEISKFPVLFLLALFIAVTIWDGARIGHLAGSFLISALILFIFYKDIRRYKPVYLKNYKMLLLLCILITGTLMLCRIFELLFSGLHRGLDFPGGTASIFGIPVPLGAMLTALIFDFHTAIIFSFALSLLTGVWLNNPFFPIYAFVGSLTAAFSVMRCRKRSGLVKGGIYVSGVNLLTAGIILLMTGALFAPSAPSAFFFAAFSGIVVASAV
jgi:hypothetical protein